MPDGNYLIYWLVAVILFVLVWKLAGIRFTWLVGVEFGVFNGIFGKLLSKHIYRKKFGQ